MSHILIAEDNRQIAAFIEKGLKAAGYQTEVASDGRDALLLATQGGFDLVILDLGLPGMDGFEVLSELRGQGHTVPVIILTARDGVGDTVAGLEGGANDYVTKPFQFAELLARIRLRLKDAPHDDANSGGATLTADDMTLDLRTRQVKLPGKTLDLTNREFGLLEVLLRNRGQVLSRPQLLGHVWGVDFDPNSNVVDVCIRALRNKIGADRIVTVRGVGYRLP